MSMTPATAGSSAGPPASKTAYTLQRLREDLAEGVILPGEALRQSDLAKRYGVSPTPVREALRLLEAEGAISYSPHRGATVSEMTEERVHDLYLLRASTEALATKLAAERRTPEQLEEIQDHHRRLTKLAGEDDASHEQLAAWSRELHLMIANAGSPVIASQIMNLWRMFPTRKTMWREPELVTCFLDQHDMIVDAITRGEGGEARQLMDEHLMTAAHQRIEALTAG